METVAILDESQRKHFELPALIAIAVAGGATGFGIMSIGGLPEDGTDLFGNEFRQSGEFRMWLFLITAQTALWAVAGALLLAPEMRRPLRGLWPDARGPVIASVAATAVPLVSVVTAVSLHSQLDYPLPWHSYKVLALSLVGIGVALIGVAELAFVKFALEHSPPERGKAKDIERYLELHTLLQRVLAIEGAIIGAAVLATGGLRNAVVAYHGFFTQDQLQPPGSFPLQPPTSFPREYVLMYGAFFTLLLAMLYVPVYLRLVEVGRRNVEAACTSEEPASEAWLPAYEKRKKLEELLQLEMATGASFRAGVAILTPLGGALVALLLGAA